MRLTTLTIYLEIPETPLYIDNQQSVCSYINNIFKNSNKHGTSKIDYSFTPIIGGTYDKENKWITYQNNPYFHFRCVNENDLNYLLKIYKSINLRYEFNGKEYYLKPVRCSQTLTDIKPYYDKVTTVSGIKLYSIDKKKYINSTDSEWINVLIEETSRKLKAFNIKNDIKIECIGDLRPSVQYTKSGKNDGSKQFNIITKGKFKISGSKEARLLLYKLGLGVNNGFSYGFLNVYD